MRQHGDAVAGADAKAPEHAGEPRHAVGEIGPGPAPVGEDDGRLGGEHAPGAMHRKGELHRHGVRPRTSPRCRPVLVMLPAPVRAGLAAGCRQLVKRYFSQ